MRLLALIVSFLVLQCSAVPQWPLDSQSWTTIAPPTNPPADPRVIYVAAFPDGNDAYNGLHPAHVSGIDGPKATIQAGHDALPSLPVNSQRWLLLREGDTWTVTGTPTIGATAITWTWSGISQAQPVIFGSYPNGPTQARPKIRSDYIGLYINNVGVPSGVQNLLITGIHFEWDDTQPERAGAQGIRVLSGPNASIRIEDCYVNGWSVGIAFDRTIGTASDISIRRCVVVDNYNMTTPQHPYTNTGGLYVEATDGLLVEECVFDRNGWNPEINTLTRHVQNHNIYIQYTCTNVTVIANISARGSADNYQLRSIRRIHKNLSLKAPTHFALIGDNRNDQSHTVVPREAEIWGNVALEGDDIDSAQPRGLAYHIKNVLSDPYMNSNMRFNIAANKGSGGNAPVGIYLDAGSDQDSQLGISNFDVHDNVVFEWSHSSDTWSSNLLALDTGDEGAPGVLFNVRLHENDLQEAPLGSAHPANATLAFWTPDTHPVTGWSSYNNEFKTRKPNQNFMRWFGTDLVVDGPPASPGWRQQISLQTLGQVVDGPPDGPVSAAQQVTYPGQSLTIVDYHQFLFGGTGSLDAFMNKCRQQRKGNWDPNLEGDQAVRYFQNAFGMPPILP